MKRSKPYIVGKKSVGNAMPQPNHRILPLVALAALSLTYLAVDRSLASAIAVNSVLLGVGLYTTSNVVDFLLTSHRSRNHFSTAFLGGVVLMILSATVRSGLRVYAALTRFNPVVDPRITNIASAIMIGAMLSLAVNEQKMDQYAEKLLWRVACAICAYVVIYLFVVNPS